MPAAQRASLSNLEMTTGVPVLRKPEDRASEDAVKASAPQSYLPALRVACELIRFLGHQDKTRLPISTPARSTTLTPGPRDRLSCRVLLGLALLLPAPLAWHQSDLAIAGHLPGGPAEPSKGAALRYPRLLLGHIRVQDTLQLGDKLVLRLPV